MSDWSSDVCSSDLEPPRTQRRAFPIVLDEANIVHAEIDPDRGQAAQIDILNVRRAGFEHHLILVIMLEPVGILAVAAVGRAAARLNEGGIPRIGAERTQRRDRKSTRLNSSH